MGFKVLEAIPQLSCLKIGLEIVLFLYKMTKCLKGQETQKTIILADER